MLEIDKLCYTSRLRYVNAGEKCFFSLASVILCIVSRSIPAALLLLLASTYLTVQRGGISLGRWLKYLTLPLFFLLLSTGAILINISQVPLDAFALPVGSLYLTGSREGVFQAVQLILTALACMSALFFLSFNTPMTDILAVLESCRLPRLLIELMMLTYRFIFLLLENASSMLLSQNARLGNKDLRTSLKSRGLLASMLFIRAMRQAGSLYDAMESRCYDGQIRVLREHQPPRRGEILCIAAFELLLLLLALLPSAAPAGWMM